MRQGYVVDTHPEDHSVDLVMLDDGSRMVGVQVLSQSGSTRSGSVNMPEVPKKKDKWDITQRTEQDQIAMVGFVRGFPVVMGYLYPQVSQMTFDDKKRSMDRHQSDVYTTVDGDGNMEIYHPSGAFVRIAENPEHEDLSGKNFDKNFKLDRNTGRRVNIRIGMGDKAYINISPDGDITIKGKSMAWDIPTTTTNGEFIADGQILSKTGVVSDGNVSAKGDVVAQGVSLVTHVHTGVVSGNDESDKPVGSSS